MTNKTRPRSLDEIVGMDHNKRMLRYDVLGSQKLNQPLPSYIIVGPAGTGKSTLADCISFMSQRPTGEPSVIYKMLGSDVKSGQDLYDIAEKVEDGDIVYLEEAHSIGGGGKNTRICQSILLEWIENFRILGGEHSLTDAPKVSFVLPTTNPGKLTKAFVSRCRTLHTSYYTVKELEIILARAAAKYDLDLLSDVAALRLLSQSSRGTPRTAIMHRLDILRKVMVVDELPYCFDTVKHALEQHHINDWGLEHNDVYYMTILANKTEENVGGPVSKKIMEQATGFANDMIDNMIESYLQQINAIRIGPRGRSLTDLGYAMIGRERSTRFDALHEGENPVIDMDKLKELLQDAGQRKLGMRGIMPDFGLKYPKHSNHMKRALLDLGFKSVQKSGIVPLDPNLTSPETRQA